MGAPGGSDTEVRVARGWLDGEWPLPGPLTATTVALGTTFGGKLIAENQQLKSNILINTDTKTSRLHACSGRGGFLQQAPNPLNELG